MKNQPSKFDSKVAQNSASMLSMTTEVVKLKQEGSYQDTWNRALWKQNRAARKQRLPAKRALLPVGQTPDAAVKSVSFEEQAWRSPDCKNMQHLW